MYNLELRLLELFRFFPKEVILKTDKSLFSNEDFAKVYERLNDFYSRYETFPSKEILPVIFPEPVLLEIAVQVLSKNDNCELGELEFIVDRLNDLKISRLAKEKILEAADEIVQGHGEEALEILSRLIEISREGDPVVGEEEDLKKSMLETTEEIFEVETKNNLELGFPQFDSYTGGVGEGQLIIFLAPTGDGKSILMMNVAKNLYDRGINIIYFLLEMSKFEWELRFHSLITSIPFRDLYSRRLSERVEYKRKLLEYFLDPTSLERVRNVIELKKDELEKLSIREFTRNFLTNATFRSNSFFVLDVPRNSSMKNLDFKIKSLKRKMNGDKFAIFIDYPGIMDVVLSSETRWSALDLVYRQLKTLARSYRVPVFTAAQLRDEEIFPGRISSELIKFSKSIIDHADLGLCWNRNSEDIRLHRIIVRPLKTRQFPCNFEIEFEEDFERMKIIERELRLL